MAQILIVDDEPINLAYMEDMLPKKGHTVAGKATTGAQAVRMAVDLKPDIILMDINMPGEYNGMEAGRRIEKTESIPVIYITAYSSEQTIRELREFGGYGYIVKPFEDTQVETAIQIALYRSRTERRLKKMILKYQTELENQIIIQYLLNKINRAVDPLQAIDELLTFINFTVKLSGIVVYRIDYNKNKKFAILTKEQESKNTDDPFPESIELRNLPVSELKEIQRINLFRRFNQFPESFRNFAEKIKLCSLLTLPLMVEGSFFGIMGFSNLTKRPFGLDFRNFLKILVNTIAISYKRHEDMQKIQRMENEKQLHEKLLLRAEQLISYGQLTSAIAHEIRQPLQSIKILTDSVLFWDKENKKMPYEDLLENQRKISARVDRIEKIIQNMNLLSKAPEKIEIKPLNLNKVVHETLEFFKQKLISHRIEIDLELDEKLKEILFSDVQLQQIIVNLINNAVNALDKISKSDKKITIRTVEKEDYIIISIGDNGPGITDELKTKIFDPFFSTGQKSDGMGMGLYIVNSILKFYNSVIDVVDNPGGGALFSVYLNRKV